MAYISIAINIKNMKFKISLKKTEEEEQQLLS